MTRALQRPGDRTWMTAALLLLAGAAPARSQVATISVVDSVGDVGHGSAVAYGPDGLALISYVDTTNGALKVAHCNDVACTTAVKATLDSTGGVGGGTSVAFGLDGRGLISYQAGAAVKVAHCADAACTSATVSTVDAAAAPAGTAIAVGTDGLGIVAYRGATGDTLKIAHCLDPDCGSAAITGYPGRYGVNPTLTIGGDGLPLVACDGDAYTMHLGHCNDQACTGATFITGTSMFPHYHLPSLTTRSDGLGELASIGLSGSPGGFWFSTFVSRCTNAACSALTGAPGGTYFEPFISNYSDLALALMPGDLAVIAKHGDNLLLVTRCLDAACGSSQQNLMVDFVGTEASPAVAVSPAGIGLITYYDSGNRDLKAAYLNDPIPIFIGDVAVVEGDAGTTAAVFQVTKLAGAASASVDFATGGGTATAGEDYLPASGTVVFPPGSTTQTVTVQIVGDVTPEPDETFFVNLSNPQGAVIGDGVGQGTILNDDVAQISIGDVTVVEGNAGTTAAVFEVSRNGTGSTSVQYATSSGTATAGVDYVTTSGTVVFPTGSTTQTITVQVIGDLAVEPDEDFFVTLSNPQGGVILDGTGECTIVDDDFAPVPVVSELAHGSRIATDLAADPGPAANVDYYRIGQAPDSSYEVVADAESGDVQPFELTRTAGDGTTVLQTATADGVGFSVSLRWQTSSTPVTSQFVRVRSGGCGTDCGSDDVYHLRSYETTLSGARFNNSATQITVLLLQNPTNAPVDATIRFWSAAGSLLATEVLTPSLAPKTTLVLNTSQIPGLAGEGGSVTVAHTAPYGALSGKTVAVEPSTGFSFDTPLLVRPW